MKWPAAGWTSPTMSISADYLRTLPVRTLQESIDQQVNQIVHGFSDYLKEAAAMGKTSYLYEIPTHSQQRHHSWRAMQAVPLTPEQLISAFKPRFPGCKITCQETRIETGELTRIIKKGILIDWSLQTERE